ncbi:hypothetical protein [Acidianus manzaensis]|uniref:DUF2029 domain-containing protein n=1 Tax=Acidianus manzaensis TaxID=282676 RepID=A0A1W6JWY3_9CREN|nr:hypothetical protein [Acidianus manzaensis]ARM74757.1 hypothetical protein B6F84_01100 [Acidianus manzaensis]
MDKRQALATNVSQLFIIFTMQIFSEPNYLNPLLIILNLSLLIIAGLMLFIKLNFRYMNIFIVTEIIASIFLYSVYFHFFSLIIALLLALFVVFGYFTSLLSEISIMVYIISFVLYFVKYAHPFFGTDEIMIDYYSAYLFLHGLNPYDPINTANVYSVFYHGAAFYAEQVFGTPLTTGGVVTNLNYPSLSFLIQIPALLLGISPNYTILVFFFATIFLYYFYLGKKNEISIFPYFISSIFLNANYLFYAQGGVTDIIWLFFVSFSLFVSDIRLKGVMYGVAVSLKQVPLFLFPFYLIYLYKERKSISKFLIYTIVTFLVFNGYFIFLNPSYYFYDFFYPITANLIGIGFGPSIFSFNGMFFIYPEFFTVAVGIIGLLELILFIFYYEKFRNTWTSFPYFMLFMMYRVLWNYLIYWPLLNYIDKENESNVKSESRSSVDTRRIVGITLISIVLIVSFAFYFHYNYTYYYDSISIHVLKIFKYDNYVYAMLVNISYTPKNANLPDVIHPYFRVFLDQPMPYSNGFLWSSNITSLHANSWEIAKVYSKFGLIAFKSAPFQIQAYYGNILGVEMVE